MDTKNQIKKDLENIKKLAYHLLTNGVCDLKQGVIVENWKVVSMLQNNNKKNENKLKAVIGINNKYWILRVSVFILLKKTHCQFDHNKITLTRKVL